MEATGSCARWRRAFALGPVCALLSLLAALSASCHKRRSAEPVAPAADDRVLRISQRNEPADLDPARATLPDEFFIIRALSEGLVTPLPLNPDSHDATAVAPAVAERWDVTADGLGYTFHLRSDARWSNGEPVTAHDFVASYRRLLTPGTAAPKASLFFMVKNARAFATGALGDFADVGFRATGPRTLVVTLDQPHPHFLVYVASGPWLPVHSPTVAEHGRAWTSPENFVGNGPFKLVQWRPNQRIVVHRNPHYHGASRVRLDAIHFIAFDSGETEERAYRAGQIDVTMSVPFSKLDTYARERPGELYRAPLAETRFLSFNTARQPLADVRVRQALALAIDRESIVASVLRGGQQPANTLVSPLLAAAADERHSPADTAGLSGAAGRASPHGLRVTFDPLTARQLLAAAGFRDGRSFPMLELSAWGVTPQVVEALQQMWQKELGVRVAIVTREAKVHLAALRDGSYDIGFINAIPDVADPANVLAEFITGAPANYPRWSDDRYDALLAAAARTTDAVARAVLLRQAESRLLEQCAVSPLYFNSLNWLMSPRVRGWQPDALWTRFYLHVEITPPR